MEFLLNHANSFIFGWAAFLIFAFVIAKFGIGPIVKAIEARDERISKQLAEAEETAAKARALQEKLDAELANAEARISEMMAEARRDAEANKAKVVEEGKGEVETLRNRALREIEAARAQAISELRTEVAEVASTVAEKILRQEIDAARHQELVESAINDYEQARG